MTLHQTGFWRVRDTVGVTRKPRRQGVGLLLAGVILLVQAPAVSVRAAAPADLRIRTTATSFKVGTNGSYNVSVRNESTIAADDTIQIVSTLPEGLTYASGLGTGWTCAGSLGRLVDCRTDAGLAPGDSTGFTLVVAVCTAAYPSVTTTFKAVYEADPDLGNNEATRSTLVKAGTCIEPPVLFGPTTAPPEGAAPTPTPTAAPAATDLSLSQGSTGLFAVGGTAAYSFRVTNIGRAATNFPITLVDTLPAGLSFVSASATDWNCSAAGQLVTCVHEEPLRAGGTSDLSLAVDVGVSAYPTVRNYTTITYVGDTNIRNNSVLRATTIRRPRRATRPNIRRATPTSTEAAAAPTQPPENTATPAGPVVPVAADVYIRTVGRGVFRIGRPASYTFAITNRGPGSTNAPITVTDTLAAGLTLDSASADWDCAVSGQDVTCTTSRSLARGQSSTLRLILTVGREAFPTVVNVVSVSYAGDPNGRNNTSVQPTTVRR